MFATFQERFSLRERESVCMCICRYVQKERKPMWGNIMVNNQ